MVAAWRPASLKFTPMGESFVAQVEGLDFSQPIPAAVRDELLEGLHKYGVLVARGTNITDDTMIALGQQWGQLDNITAHKKAGRTMRLPQDEIFDVSNIDPDDNIITVADALRTSSARGNAMWHADGAYNPRRSGISILRAVELPPKGMGGETEFLDTRTAYEDLPAETKQAIDGLVGLNTLMWNRKQANPEMQTFKDIDCTKVPLSKHKIAQVHEPSGRGNLYIGSYNHHIDGMPVEEGRKLIDDLMAHVMQDKYKFAVHYENSGDVTFWDNTAVLHRATLGQYHGKYRRDMRRISTFDNSSWAYGENDPLNSQQVGLT
ncbi:hypothetical protein LTR10_023042 [Elasticomyces elasticus]|uniref:TauD/TfdA-like domain-containing protein n=1 Tax=Exophiala sideris TaxID=1016849 RepID=A0ABR0IUL7_9EURO|nr:hypothetical protein LTR10_023042 [Elasticomyces elasticus]KAK5021036.1 hypothetical protein LTS07_011291 [Exophiala sideris]KAK5023323.1 hypothetical protein LTR13_011235 [Exophiala sideris]KAK5048762.1 hypothetical protein LTR69_011308 [Exophiala sideris]KAK5176174.1 hypothetical protein LTR44_011269 [Eurotiomycetes sp. CCFEE 6388]